MKNSKFEVVLNQLSGFQTDKEGIYLTGKKGYWSNLSKEENSNLIFEINKNGPKKAIKTKAPHLFEMIYSLKREAALELLDMNYDGICIDYGCMWGVLSVAASKRVSQVIAIDQTYDSLYFLRKRCIEENISNITCLHGDIKNIGLENIADYAIVNGVLEWVPITRNVEVSDFYKGNISISEKNINPKKIQQDFLKRVHKSLVKDGKLVLAIENRHSYQYYMGMKDPHANLMYTTFLPRFISNLVSKIFRNRPYENYIYSFKEIERLLIDSGFSDVKRYASFPNYHFPQLILDYSSEGFNYYSRYPNVNRITIKQKIAYGVEIILMKYLKLKWFSPAIIVVAKK
jgi:ubiquinone/menaquinone biosynthesis C-methylase UbiE